MYEISITSADGKKSDFVKDTVAEGLTEYRPELIKGKIILDVKNTTTGKNANKVIFVPVARRMFYNPNALQIFARNIERTLL